VQQALKGAATDEGKQSKAYLPGWLIRLSRRSLLIIGFWPGGTSVIAGRSHEFEKEGLRSSKIIGEIGRGMRAFLLWLLLDEGFLLDEGRLLMITERERDLMRSWHLHEMPIPVSCT
jgi:hypothetical protein